MNQIVDELYQWRPYQDYVDSYRMDEYNDGIAHPEPPPVRLADCSANPDLEHPIVLGMLRELGEIAAESAAGSLPSGTVRVCAAWPPTDRPAKTHLVQVTAGWWSLAARHPGGPYLALMDGSGLYDMTTAPGTANPLDTMTMATTKEPLPWPCGLCGHPRRARDYAEDGWCGRDVDTSPWICDDCEATTAAQ